MKKHHTEWQDNYGCERSDFETYFADVLGWDADMLTTGANGRYEDKNVERMFVLWFEGWSNGFDRGHHSRTHDVHVSTVGTLRGIERQGAV